MASLLHSISRFSLDLHGIRCGVTYSLRILTIWNYFLKIFENTDILHTVKPMEVHGVHSEKPCLMLTSEQPLKAFDLGTEAIKKT